MGVPGASDKRRIRIFRLDMTRDRDGFTSTARSRRLFAASGIFTRVRNLPFAFVLDFDLPRRVHRVGVLPLACPLPTERRFGVAADDI